MEAAFPRGQVKGKAVSGGKKSSETLFGRHQGGGIVKKRRRHENRNDKWKPTADSGEVKERAGPDPLTRGIITPGLTTLATIHQIHDYDLLLRLPNNTRAVASIADICPAYTRQLSKLAAEEDKDDVDAVAGLADLFVVGQLVSCKVVEVEGQSIKTTLNPADVNSLVEARHLYKGRPIWAAVKSVEEKGYTMDVGVPGLVGFLSNSAAQHYTTPLGLQRLSTGHCLWCLSQVSSTEEEELRVIKLRPLAGEKEVVFPEEVDLVRHITPAQAMKCTVSAVHTSGLTVTFFSHSGYIHKTHLAKPVDSYSLTQHLSLTVLFSHPLTKIVYFTELSVLRRPLDCISQFRSLSVGTVVKDCSILFWEQKRGVYVEVPVPKGDNLRGFIKLGQLVSGKTGVLDQVPIAFKEVGKKLTCRVLDQDHIDAALVVSSKQETIDMEFLRLTDFKPGTPVSGRVKNFVDAGLVIKLDNSPDISGFAPLRHLAEIPLKNPQQRFKLDMRVKCRVLKVDMERRRVTLTLKKQLVQSDLATAASAGDVTPGTHLLGYVITVKAAGVLIGFYGDLSGWCPCLNVPGAESSTIKAMFYEGQVVKVKVLRRDIKHPNRLWLSMETGEEELSNVKERKSAVETSPHAIGSTVSCTVTIVVDNGLRVTVEGKDGVRSSSGVIPLTHLSDYLGLCGLLKETYSAEEEIPAAVCINSTPPLYSLKPSLLLYAKRGEMVATLANLAVGSRHYGWVKNVTKFGVFVDLPGILTGLCPLRFLGDAPVPDLVAVFQPGLSVEVKVLEKNEQNKRFVVSCRAKDLPRKGNNKNLRDAITDLKRIKNCSAVKQRCRKILKLEVGKVVKVELKRVSEDHAEGETAAGVPVWVEREQFHGKKVAVGDSVSAIIIYQDVANSRLECSFNQRLISTFKDSPEKTHTLVVKDRVKSQVVCAKKTHTLVELQDHGVGQLAIVPAIRHVNDALVPSPFAVGQTNLVTICEVGGPLPLAYLSCHSDVAQPEKPQVTGKKDKGAMTARVLENSGYRLKLDVGGAKAVLHATEVAQKLVEGTRPLEQYKVGDELEVRLLDKFRPSLKKKNEKVLSQNATLKLGKAYCRTIGDFTTDRVIPVIVKGFAPPLVYVQTDCYKTTAIHFMNFVADPLSLLDRPHVKYPLGVVVNTKVVTPDPKLLLTVTPPAASPQVGAVVAGFITEVTAGGGVKVTFPDLSQGVVSLTDIRKEHSNLPTEGILPHTIRDFLVLSLQKSERKLWNLSLRESELKKGRASTKNVIRRSAEALASTKLRGYIVSAHAAGVSVCVGTNCEGLATWNLVSDKFIPDSERDTALPPGTAVTAVVVGKNLKLSLLKKDTDVELPLADSFCKREKSSKKRVSEGSTSEKSVSEEPSTAEPVIKKAKKEAVHKVEEVEVDSVPPAFDFSATEVVLPGKKTLSAERLAVAPEEDTTDLEMSERSIAAEELRLASTDEMNITSAADFDRLLLRTPNSSLLWTRYMALHMAAQSLDEAAAVAERALLSIAPSEEEEKFNVWAAYLGLQVLYGTRETLDALVKRAVRSADAWKMYSKLLDILLGHEKWEQADELFQTLTKKFSQESAIWQRYCEHLFSRTQVEAARRVLNRALDVLPVKEHISVIQTAARCEFSHGAVERGQTLFEQIISNYPRRLDVWNVYTDLLAKHNQLETARMVFERATSLELSLKKMRSVFRKNLEFERSHGDEATQAAVQRKAMKYLESVEGGDVADL